MRLDVPSAESSARTIMAGDRLRIEVDEQPEINRVYAVAGDGTIDFPMTGRVRIAGMTTDNAADAIEQKLEEKYFKQATVRVNVAEFVEGAILITGAVVNPGAIQFKGDQILSLIEAIIMSGGLLPGAAGNEVRILRWTPGGGMERKIVTVDVASMFESLDFSNDQFLRARDIVVVPTLGESGEGTKREFLALGQVNRGGFHPWTEGLDIIRAVTLAGGVSRDAQMDAARLLRRGGSGDYTAIPIDLTRLFGAADMSVNVSVNAGDILFVPAMQHATGGQVYLLGAVNRQGAIPLPLNRDITLARTILESGGFGEYANDGKVKIMRRAPDGSKQEMTVNVGRILKTGSFEDDVPLRNGDVIIVPESMLGF